MAATPADESRPSDVPDVLGPNLRCVFCGINPGRVSAAAAAHFANPRNDFWRLLHDGGFTPRLFDPQEQFQLLELGYGVTNAAYRTTPGSGDLRRGDFDAARLERIARDLEPDAIAFVGKEAYRGVFGERTELGPQERALATTGLFVLPSTSPANAAVPYAERARWFRALRTWLDPAPREAVRAVLVDDDNRVLLVQYVRPITGARWWGTPGGGIDDGETHDEALRRELREELGLHEFELAEPLWTHARTFPWARALYRQVNHVYLVRVPGHEPAPTVDLSAEGVSALRWWTAVELADAEDDFAPPDLVQRLRNLLA